MTIWLLQNPSTGQILYSSLLQLPPRMACRRPCLRQDHLSKENMAGAACRERRGQRASKRWQLFSDTAPARVDRPSSLDQPPITHGVCPTVSAGLPPLASNRVKAQPNTRETGQKKLEPASLSRIARYTTLAAGGSSLISSYCL